MGYKKQQLIELSKLYNINLNTLLSHQKKGKQAVDLVVIKKICIDKGLTLEEFMKAFELLAQHFSDSENLSNDIIKAIETNKEKLIEEVLSLTNN